MKSLIAYLGTSLMFVLAFLLYFIPSLPEAAAQIVTTQTVTGYAVPNASGLNVALVPFLLPIIITGLFTAMIRVLEIQGDTSSFIIKIGMLIGSLLGMLSLTSSKATLIPFTFPFIAGVYFITYLWKRV